MILKTASLVSAAMAACLLSACAIPVTSQVNEAVVHTVQCHSFAWAGSFQGGPLTSTIANPVNEAQLRSAIQSHFESSSAVFSTSNPDCLVGYGIGVHGVLTGWDWGAGWGPWWGGPYWGGPYVYPEAVVVVDLYAARSHQPIWHANARVAPSSLEGDRARQGIGDAVAAIFTKYPH
jgi:hypothetical protein